MIVIKDEQYDALLCLANDCVNEARKIGGVGREMVSSLRMWVDTFTSLSSAHKSLVINEEQGKSNDQTKNALYEEHKAKVIKHMDKYHVTQAEIAKELGKHYSTISRKLNCLTETEVETLIATIKKLGKNKVKEVNREKDQVTHSGGIVRGNLLRELMKSLNVSVEEIESKSNIPPNTVRGILSRCSEENYQRMTNIIQAVAIDKKYDNNTEKQKFDKDIPHEPNCFITLLLNDKSEYTVTMESVKEYKELYPSVDVEQALRSMKGWCISNPAKRKTRSGICRFINSWLAREQNGYHK